VTRFASSALDALARLRSDERLLVICGSTVLVMAGQGVVGPVLPIYADNFGVSTAVVGLTFTAFGLARLLLNVPAGLWADRAGRRVLLIGGPLITAIGMIGSGLAPTIWVLLLWRLVAGAGSALYMTGAQIYLIDIAGDAQRARYIATNQGALLVGVSVGPAVGGLLADAYGLRAPFLVVGAGALLTGLYGFLRLPETLGTRPGDKPGEEPGDGVGSTPSARRKLPPWEFVLSRQFVAIGVVTFAIFSVRSGFRQTLVPLVGVDKYGLDPGDLGLLFTMLGVVGLVLVGPAGWAADRFGRKPTIVPPGYLGAVGIVIAALAPSPTWFAVGLLISSIGTGVSGPAPAAFVADIAPPDLRGSAMGLYRTWGDLGLVLAPLLAGLLADATNRETAMVAIAVLVVVAITWFFVVAVEPPRPVPEPAPV
jgi:MFS family permease